MRVVLFYENKPHYGKLRKTPSLLTKTAPSWAKTEFWEYETGYLLIRHYTLGSYRIASYRLNSNKPVKLYAEHESPLIVLQYMTRERTKMCSGLPKYGCCRLVYMPNGEQEVRCSAGTVEWMQIELRRDYNDDMMEELFFMSPLLDVSGLNEISCGEIVIDYQAKALCKRMQDCQETGHYLNLEFRICISKLMMNYLDGLKEKLNYSQLPYGVHTKVLLEIHDSIIAAPDINRYTPTYLAKQYDVTPEYIETNFSALFGISLSDFAEEQCMGKAMYLLQNTRNTVSEIARETGYASYEEFSATYKKYYGLPPYIHRERLKTKMI